MKLNKEICKRCFSTRFKWREFHDVVWELKQVMCPAYLDFYEDGWESGRESWMRTNKRIPEKCQYKLEQMVVRKK